jgi:multiple antibiotic resistance protein
MWQLLEPYLLTFIPIFVAVDAIGTVPLFISIMDGTTKKQRHQVIIDSVTTATSVAILFMLVGKLVLRLIGISIPDFQIAGGLLLLVIAMRLLLPGASKSSLINHQEKDIGVFPLGTPLITGPAVLTTTLIMLDTYGLVPTFIALLLNMVIVWWSLVKTDLIIKIFGQAGTRAFAKIMYILLAAIGVMMIRKGMTSIIQGAF